VLVSSGKRNKDSDLIIVDPELKIQCRDNQIGEIWIKSQSVAKGYWNKPIDTEKFFYAYLSDENRGPFLRTGDIGFISEDELFVTGRIKDLIIIRGKNYFPNDIEETVWETHEVLRYGCGAAFSINDENDEEKLVIVQELKRTYKDHSLHDISKCITKNVFKHHNLEIHKLLLVEVGSVPKTSSGKLQRFMCRNLFLEGNFNSISIT
jgi:acyl-CoA synthetase (AMP-forming)/AMP-acid ligase II